jgi:ribosomal protein S18 acetylase RimI-like enzyme
MTTAARDVRIAQACDEDAVMAVLTLAFATDPPTRYIFFRPEAFAAGFRRFASVTGGPSLAAGAAYLADDGAAAAVWLPPGVRGPLAAIGPLLQEFAPPERLPVLARVGEAVQAFHPDAPHWYLSMIGVDPMRQGRGLGSALLEAGLARCDSEGASVYLESSNPKNIPLYERYGFEALGVIEPDDFPPLTPMLRPAR